MLGYEFIQLGQKIVGMMRGYQRPLAIRLGISVMTVKRYASGNSAIPRSIELFMRELVK
jgi:transcriptional regulator with XRE-family HTH domain